MHQWLSDLSQRSLRFFNVKDKDSLTMQCLCMGVLMLMWLQIIVAAIWAMFNMHVIVPYGDVCEYIRLAHTMILDMWRPIAYPLFVRFCIVSGHALGVPFYTLVYILQSIISLAAVYYLIRTLWVCFAGGVEPFRPLRGVSSHEPNHRFGCSLMPKLTIKNFLGTSERRKLLFLSLFAASNPLLMHFNFSCLTDSLCNSFSMLFAAEVLMIMRSSKLEWQHIIFGIVSFVLMCLLRAERLMLMGTIVFILSLTLVFVMKGPGKKRVIASIMMIIIIAVPVTNFIKSNMQTANVGRLEPSVHTALYQRVGFHHFFDNYDYMPEHVTQNITRYDAFYNDASQLNTNTICAAILQKDPENYNRILDSVWITVLIHDSYRVVKDIFIDFVCNVFAPVTYNIVTLHTIATTGLTLERMTYGTPDLAWFYMRVSEITFWLFTVTFVFRMIRNKRFLKEYSLLWIGLFAFVIMQSVFYAGTSNYGFHIRYQLFNYSLQIITFIFVFGVGTRRNRFLKEDSSMN